MSNFIQLIETHAKTHPNRKAITVRGKSVTYSELYQQMNSVGYHATKYGFKQGDNLVFACKPNLRSLAFALGMVRAGITLSIIDPFTSDELFKNRCELAGVTHSIGNPLVYLLGKHRKTLYRFTGKQLANLASISSHNLSFGKTRDMVNAEKWLDNTTVTSENSSVEEQPAIIVFTSGTTSEPKGVVHTIQTLSSNMDDFAKTMGIYSTSKVYAEPMTLGLVTLAHGGEWIIPDHEKRFPPADIWFATPADILKGLEILKKQKRPRAFTTIGIGAAPVLTSLVEEIESVVAAENILCVYGMTEILPIAVGNARSKPQYINQGDFVGYPIGDTKIIVEDNELMVSGSALTKGYLGKPPLNSLPTGDFGEVTDSGEIILKGRKKDMFIRGDMNIYPALYESRLATIQGVAQVAMVGIPDIFGDDEVVLAITVQSGYNSKTVQQNVIKQMAQFVDAEAKPSDVVVLDVFPVSGRADKLDRIQLTENVKRKLNK